MQAYITFNVKVTPLLSSILAYQPKCMNFSRLKLNAQNPYKMNIQRPEPLVLTLQIPVLCILLSSYCTADKPVQTSVFSYAHLALHCTLSDLSESVVKSIPKLDCALDAIKSHAGKQQKSIIFLVIARQLPDTMLISKNKRMNLKCYDLQNCFFLVMNFVCMYCRTVICACNINTVVNCTQPSVCTFLNTELQFISGQLCCLQNQGL